MANAEKTAHETWEQGLAALGAPLHQFVPGLRPELPVDVAEPEGLGDEVTGDMISEDDGPDQSGNANETE